MKGAAMLWRDGRLKGRGAKRAGEGAQLTAAEVAGDCCLCELEHATQRARGNQLQASFYKIGDLRPQLLLLLISPQNPAFSSPHLINPALIITALPHVYHTNSLGPPRILPPFPVLPNNTRNFSTIPELFCCWVSR